MFVAVGTGTCSSIAVVDIYRLREEWFPPRTAADDRLAHRHRIADLLREAIDGTVGE